MTPQVGRRSAGAGPVSPKRVVGGELMRPQVSRRSVAGGLRSRFPVATAVAMSRPVS
jgi:hypothetical protein